MSKTKLSNEKRERVLSYMMDRHRESRDSASFDDALKAVVTGMNKAIRTRYPEKDMKVLRKYKQTRQDACLRFAVIETGQVFGIDFSQRFGRPYYGEHMGDMPIRSGCGFGSSDTLPCDQALADAAHAWEEALSVCRLGF